MNHPNHVMRESSLSAFHDNLQSGLFDRTTTKIVDLLRNYPEGLTRKEIAVKTGLESNQVTGRVKEMLKRHTLEEPGTRMCSIGKSKRPVNIVRLRADEE